MENNQGKVYSTSVTVRQEHFLFLVVFLTYTNYFHAYDYTNSIRSY